MTKTVQDIIEAMEKLAPLHLAEAWDNPGLMVGHKEQELKGIMTTLDVTLACVERAIELSCNMIVSHHPFIFKGIKKLKLDETQGRMIELLIKHDIAVYSAHTNLDIAEGGLNDMLAKRLGLKDITGLAERGSQSFYKLACFVPKGHSEAVRQAIAKAGAGRLGNYEACSFTSTGEGRFFPLEGANPYIGKVDALEIVEEECIEAILPQYALSKVLSAMVEAHPYEEPAYEVLPLERPKFPYHLGRIGSLEETMDGLSFAQYVQGCLPKAVVRFAGKKDQSVKRVALCSGAASEFLQVAKAKGADAYITGDMKYHEAQLALEMGIFAIDAGHFGTEEFVKDGLKDYLLNYMAQKQWPKCEVYTFEEQEDFFTYLP